MKLRVGVIYGGRSGEHEVSVVSAASIFKYIDRSRFEPVPIRIDKDGRWMLGSKEPTAISAGDVKDGRPERAHLQVTEPTSAIGGNIDVVFPVLHGPYGEDGTVQGLLELANVPYVGAGVLGSALGMDKACLEDRFRRARAADRSLPDDHRARVAERAPAEISDSRRQPASAIPAFVKPANLGSSVGISRVTSDGELSAGDPHGASSTTARSWSRPVCRTRARSNAPCWATTSPKPRCPARSSSPTPMGSTPTRRSISIQAGPRRGSRRISRRR